MSFLIDDIEIIVLEEGFADLLAIPQVKEPLKNDWEDENGLDVELSRPLRLEAREVEFGFLIKNENDTDRLKSKAQSSPIMSLSILGEIFTIRLLSLEIMQSKTPLLFVEAKAKMLIYPKRKDISVGDIFASLPLLRESLEAVNYSLTPKMNEPQASRYQDDGAFGNPLSFAEGLLAELHLLLSFNSSDELWNKIFSLQAYLISPEAKEISISEHSFTAFYLSSEAVDLFIKKRDNDYYGRLRLKIIMQKI